MRRVGGDDSGREEGYVGFFVYIWMKKGDVIPMNCCLQRVEVFRAYSSERC